VTTATPDAVTPGGATPGVTPDTVTSGAAHSGVLARAAAAFGAATRGASAPSAAALRAARRRGRRHDSSRGRQAGPVWAFVAWVLTLLFFAPVAWMVLTSFHSEADAATNPPSPLAPLTTVNYSALFDRGIAPYLINSAMASIVSTLLVLVLALPTAYALSVKPVQKWSDVLFFFLSTKFLPAIAALLPIYLIIKQIGMLDNTLALIILYTSMNLPLAVWMMRSFLNEVPIEILEAAQVDGAGLVCILRRVVAPVAMPGIAATSLICIIFSWNEFMFAVNLTAVRAATAPVFLVGFITSEGLFLGKLCAAATLVSLPVLVAGFAAQDKLVQGLSLGAVK
jgi:sorbitol/mannitol transport system permease protein